VALAIMVIRTMGGIRTLPSAFVLIYVVAAYFGDKYVPCAKNITELTWVVQMP
jgi:hypothetical protein